MANVTISQTIKRKRIVDVPLVACEVTDVFFMRTTNRVVITVNFLREDGRTSFQEFWQVKGPALNAALGEAPTGTSLLKALSDGMEAIVDKVENTEGLKEKLIARGELRIFGNARVSLGK
jgi:hypothetical protein